MTSRALVKNHLIRVESFEREEKGRWIPQYNFTRRNIGTKSNDFPSQQYQFNQAFPTEDKVDDFALQKVLNWIDQN